MAETLLDLGAVHQTWKKETRAWRAAHDVDGALCDAAAARRVAPVKRLYPHYLHGRSPSGAVIFFELLGRLDTSVLASGEVDKAGIVRHFCLAHEWISRTFEGEGTRLVTVLDAGGLRWSEVNAAFLQLLGAASEVTESLVPYWTERVLVVNAPRWFSAVFGTVKSVLPATSATRSTPSSRRGPAAALAALCGDALPPAYGGRGPALGDHAFERAFLRDAADFDGADDADDTDEFHDCEGPRADEAEDGDVWHECESGVFEFFSDEDLSESDDDDRAPAAARVVEDRADDAAAAMAAPARVVEDHFGDDAAQIRAAELRASRPEPPRLFI
ncbi:hypothetical protein JL721_13052 [Aureococcus anophagefferens]|nr:hypothetical protein JL721_13052 [Aureococcus anophagefferens]